MSKWNFNEPYRLMDARVACGIQAGLDPDQLAKVCVSLPELWGELSGWRRKAAIPFDEYSLELAVPASKKGNTEEGSYAGLNIRLAFSKDSSAADVCETILKIKKLFGSWLKGKNIQYSDPVSEDAPLGRFPVWDANLDTRIDILCFGKKARKTTAQKDVSGAVRGRNMRKTAAAKTFPLVWYPELTEGTVTDLFALADMQMNAPESGISFEIHSLSEDLCQEAASLNSDPECMEWLNKIAEKKAVFSRLLIWGSRHFSDAAAKLVLSKFDLQAQKLVPSDRFLHYMVYDPWACEEELANQNSRLGKARYALTYDEFAGIFCSTVIPVPGNDPVLEPLNMPQRISTDISAEAENIYDTVKNAVKDALKETIHPDIQDVISKVDRLQTEAENAQKLAADFSREILNYFTENRENLTHLAEKMDNISELVNEFKNLAPEGFPIEFTADELKYLGVSNEEELISLKNLDNDTVHLMSTAFSIARAGMNADNTQVILMPFFLPLGSLFEHLMRKLFQPSIFDNSPLKAKLNVKASSTSNSGNYEIQASSFDLVNYDQLQSYKDHAVVDGRLHSYFYWLSWLNIFKPIRIARNKVHTTRGDVTPEQLKYLYELMLLPEIGPKLNALRYAVDHQDDDKESLYLPKRYSDFEDFLQEMCRNSSDYKPSVINFLILCRDSEWK